MMPFTTPIDRLRETLRDLRGGKDAEDTLIAICETLNRASSDAVTACDSQLSLFPKSHFIGQSKYHMMQERFLQVCLELGLPASAQRHPGTTSCYAALEHPRLRMTLAKVQRYDQNPRLHPFRLVTSVKHFRPDQLPLLPNLHVAMGEQLVVVIVFGFTQKDRASPAFIEARFLGDDGVSFSDFALDLRSIRKAVEFPAKEPDQEQRTPTVRVRKRRSA